MNHDLFYFFLPIMNEDCGPGSPLGVYGTSLSTERKVIVILNSKILKWDTPESSWETVEAEISIFVF